MPVKTAFEIVLHMLEELQRMEANDDTSKSEVVRACRNHCFLVISTLFSHPLNYSLAAPFCNRGTD